MPIPELDAHGLLPAGQWDCTLAEVEAVFCLNPHRCALWEGLQRFIAAEVKPLGSLTLWLDGSFTRSKAHPEDIDVVIFPDAASLVAAKPYEPYLRTLFADPRRSVALYHCDAYLVSPGDMHKRAYWRGLLGFCHDETTPKGFIELPL